MDNNNELEELSIEQINTIYNDILEFEDDSVLLSGPACKSGSGDNCYTMRN